MALWALRLPRARPAEIAPTGALDPHPTVQRGSGRASSGPDVTRGPISRDVTRRRSSPPTGGEANPEAWSTAAELVAAAERAIAAAESMLHDAAQAVRSPPALLSRPPSAWRRRWFPQNNPGRHRQPAAARARPARRPGPLATREPQAAPPHPRRRTPAPPRNPTPLRSPPCLQPPPPLR